MPSAFLESLHAFFKGLSGPFSNAHDFVIGHLIMAKTVNILSNGKTVLEHLAPYTMPDAAVDSSARYPPAQCYPGTRVEIGTRLMDWLDTSTRQWNMIWLYGSAGTGKSAVAQTFAEKCVKEERLGGAFFFSRPNNRNNPKTVIPTIAYQLAVLCPSYKDILASRLDKDPQLLTKALHVQFEQLIVEPFSVLQTRRRQRIKKPLLIILDGLDECAGQDAQCQFIKLIAQAASRNKGLPLLWLICSRPEAHLQRVFEGIADCGREELTIDEECQRDVNRYLHEALEEIRVKFDHVTGPSWPPLPQFEAFSTYASGLFVLAGVGVAFVGDPEYGNPVERLDVLVSYLGRTEESTDTNPLARLDALYSCILDDIPKKTFPLTWRILAHLIYIPTIPKDFFRNTLTLPTTQILCNFLHVNRSMFYGAVRKLYSVIDIPVPDQADSKSLRFYHASFQEFLTDAKRSGRFVVKRDEALVDIVKSCLFWHEIDAGHFHVNDNPDGSRRSHHHASLPGLKWTSGKGRRASEQVIKGFANYCWKVCEEACETGLEQELLSYLQQLDFRYLSVGTLIAWTGLVNALYERDPTNGLIRSNSCDEVDNQLLDYLKTMTNQDPVKPASLPIADSSLSWKRRETRGREYLFVGRGTKAVLVWYTICGPERADKRVDTLIYGQEPSPDKIQEYQQWLEKQRWYDHDVDDTRSLPNSDE